jgi:hypothetical protein
MEAELTFNQRITALLSLLDAVIKDGRYTVERLNAEALKLVVQDFKEDMACPRMYGRSQAAIALMQKILAIYPDELLRILVEGQEKRHAETKEFTETDAAEEIVEATEEGGREGFDACKAIEATRQEGASVAEDQEGTQGEVS